MQTSKLRKEIRSILKRDMVLAISLALALISFVAVKTL